MYDFIYIMYIFNFFYNFKPTKHILNKLLYLFSVSSEIYSKITITQNEAYLFLKRSQMQLKDLLY